MSLHAGGVLAHRSANRTVVAGALAVLASLAIISTTLAANVGPTRVLSRVSSRTQLWTSDIAGKGKNIATAWVEDFVPYVRWSTDGGATFHDRVGVDGDTGAALDICAGFVWAVTTQPAITYDDPPPLNDRYMQIDAWSLDSPAHRQLTFRHGTGFGEVACIGDRALATVWLREVEGSPHSSLQIWTISGHGHLTRAHAFDLGPIGEITPTLAATNAAVYVSWMEGRNLLLKSFDLGAGPSPSAMPRPTTMVTTFDRSNAGGPILAADGSRVAIAYYFKEQVRVRISQDGGDSFGDYTILKRLPPHSNGYAVPLSIDAFAGQVLVEVISDGDAPPLEWEGFLRDAGGMWRSTFSQRVGSQYGALFGNQQQPKFVEVWDDSAKYPPPHVQKLRFHTGTQS